MSGMCDFAILRRAALVVPLCLAALTPAARTADAVVPANATLVDTAAETPAFDQAISDAKSVMMADPEAALGHARRAVVLASGIAVEQARLIAESTAHWLEAEALVRLNRPKEAKPIIDAALGVVERIAKDTKLNGDLLMTRANVAATTGDVQGALSDFQSAHNIFQSIGAKRSQAIALQNIGSIYSEAGDYKRVLEYYDQSAAVYSDDPALNVSAYNNRGNAYKELGEFAKAEQSYRAALALVMEMKSPLLEARIMTNIASMQFLQNRLDDADATALAALELAASGPAAGWAPYIWGVRAQVAFARGEPATAKTYIETTFRGVDLATTTMPFRDFHKAAVAIYRARGDFESALAHLEAFKRLDDEAHVLVTSANAALMSAQFDDANQKLAISELQAGQMERDRMIAASNAQMQAMVMYGVIGGSVIVVALALGAFFSIRRSRNATHAANVKLNTTNMALEKAVKARTEFLATTSHEMRTPLNGILGMAQIVLMDETLNPAQRENVELIESAGRTMKLLIDDILDVAKMEAGRLVLEERPFSVRSVLNEVATLSMAQAEAKGLSLEVTIEDGLDRWIGDEHRLRQVVYNLMSNALKFTERGTVQLSAETVETPRGPMLEICVADSGIGIPQDAMQRVFESFAQADASVTRRYGGTGLGLAICSHIVRSMNGEIDVASTVGSGSRFRVRLPLPAGHADTVEEPANPSGRPGVLVCDSNLLSQNMLAAQLEADGFHVVTSDNVAEALSIAETQSFAHVLVAASVLDADAVAGLGAIREMRALQSAARLTIVNAAAETAPLYLQCGADSVEPEEVPPVELSAWLQGFTRAGDAARDDATPRASIAA